MPLIKKNIEKLTKPFRTMTQLNYNTTPSIKAIDVSCQPLSTVEYKKMFFLTLLNKTNHMHQSKTKNVENPVNDQIFDQIKGLQHIKINKKSIEFSTRTSKSKSKLKTKTLNLKRSDRGGGRHGTGGRKRVASGGHETGRRHGAGGGHGSGGGYGSGGGRGRRGRGRGRGRNQSHYNRNKRKKSPPLPKGILKIQSTFNNTIVTISNLKGNVIGWSSAGTNGFKGARKSTAYAAKKTAEAAVKRSLEQGLKRAKILVKGIGPGRESALRSISETNLEIAFVRDVTGLPHNGCRPRKKRRI